MRNLYFLAAVTLLANPVFGQNMNQLMAYTAEIVHFSPDQNSSLAQFNLQNGQVVMDGNKVTLKLWEAQNCLPGTMCIAVMPRYVEFSANILETSNSCGSIYYHAVDDQTPVDGVRTEIVVVDHSKRLCRDFLAFKTEVKMQESGWNRMTRDQFIYNHYFGANKLQANELHQ